MEGGLKLAPHLIWLSAAHNLLPRFGVDPSAVSGSLS